VISTFLPPPVPPAVLLHSPELAESWTKPSALAESRISGLAGHLGGQVGNVTASWTPPCPWTCR
jgi:hypothetical protein